MPLTQPQRDARGFTIPHDHPEILGSDKVIRRISAEHHVSVEEGGRRISTVAFAPSKDEYRGLSIDIERSIVEAGIDPRVFVTTPRFSGSVWFAAEALRAEGLQVGFDPMPENPHHGEVWGIKSKAKQRAVRKLASWYVEIKGVSAGA